MSNSVFHNAESGFLEKRQLMKLKLKAMRSGVWFKALNRIDRVLVDLTIKVAGTVRSFTLANKILTVIRKLESVMESKFLRAIKEMGVPIARRLGLIAQQWGNRSAKNWESDGDFARYLAAMAFNEPRVAHQNLRLSLQSICAAKLFVARV
jgi:hypothetical protein